MQSVSSKPVNRRRAGRILLVVAVVVASTVLCGPWQRSSGAEDPSEFANAYSPANVEQGIRSVRDIDWRNRAYRVSGPGGVDELVVKRGRVEWIYVAENPRRLAPGARPADPQVPVEHGLFLIEPPLFGDVDADGIEDVVLFTHLNDGGNALMTGIKAFTVKNGTLGVLGTIPGGFRADGNIRKVGLDGSTILVQRWLWSEGEPMCCPARLRFERWKWDGNRFAEDVSARRVKRVRLRDAP